MSRWTKLELARYLHDTKNGALIDGAKLVDKVTLGDTVFQTRQDQGLRWAAVVKCWSRGTGLAIRQSVVAKRTDQMS
jgi:hypothetical protein